MINIIRSIFSQIETSSAKHVVKEPVALSVLKNIHANLFPNGTPIIKHPGEFRKPVRFGGWVKERPLESMNDISSVYYSRMDTEAKTRLEKIMSGMCLDDLRKLNASDLAEKFGMLYAQIDYCHSFEDGNSRTLRAFFLQIATKCGYDLQWEGTDASQETRDSLYISRDLSVNAIAKRFTSEKKILQNIEEHRKKFSDYPFMNTILSQIMVPLELKPDIEVDKKVVFTL